MKPRIRVPQVSRLRPGFLLATALLAAAAFADTGTLTPQR